MSEMVRKQFYIHKRQQILLKRLSQARGVSEAEIVRQAISVGASVVWLQLGIASDEAAALGQQAGLTVIMDLCMGATHRKLEIGPRS